MRMPLPFWNALFDLSLMPLECPSCNERKVSRIKAVPDKRGMCSLVASVTLALRPWQYTSPFTPQGSWRELVAFSRVGTVFHAQMGLDLLNS